MAMFNKNDQKPTRDRPAPAPRVSSGEGAISIIGPGMRIEGDLATDGTVRIEGMVQGTIRAGKAVVLGQNGEIVGDIYTRDAVIGGRVKGTLVADSRLELQGSCVVDGEIRARAAHLQLAEGATFNGQIRMIDGEEALIPAPPPRVPEPAEEVEV
ncbi:MAG TPA: polymer-forming cytoskeletal protein [Longimicrobiaceae bacterium]